MNKRDRKQVLVDEDLVWEQITAFKEAFAVYDNKGKGVIQVDKLSLVMRHLGFNPTEKEIVDILNELDVDAKGRIKLQDFMRIMIDRVELIDSAEEMQKVFRVFDRDRNGRINAIELKYMISNLGQSITDEEIDEILKEADVDGDGQLDYEEFVSMLASGYTGDSVMEAAAISAKKKMTKQ